MTLIDGDQYTQLTNLNVTDTLRINEVIVTPGGGGGIVGPNPSTVTGLGVWADIVGGELLNTGVLIDANNNMSYTAIDASVGIDWSANITQKLVTSTGVLSIQANNTAAVDIDSWNADGATDSIRSSHMMAIDGVLNLAVSTWDGNGVIEDTTNINLNGSATSAIIVTDAIQEKGMVYAADYSDKYTIRSLVDKEYVDNADITIIGVLDAENGTTVEISTTQIEVIGSKYIIKDQAGTAGPMDVIEITGEGAATIDGEDDLEIVTEWGVARLYSDGTNLFGW